MLCDCVFSCEVPEKTCQFFPSHCFNPVVMKTIIPLTLLSNKPIYCANKKNIPWGKLWKMRQTMKESKSFNAKLGRKALFSTMKNWATTKYEFLILFWFCWILIDLTEASEKSVRKTSVSLIPPKIFCNCASSYYGLSKLNFWIILKKRFVDYFCEMSYR